MDERDDSIDWRLVAIAFMVTATVLVVRAITQAATVPLFNDTDDAMRLVQVRDLLAGQDWFDLTQHRLNTPDGASMHWSRLVDAGIAGLVLLFSPLGPATAEIVAAYAWPLLLLLAMLVASAGLAVRLGGRGAELPGVLLPAFSLVTLTEFIPGRIDHHSVQIVLALVMAWAALGAIRRPAMAIWAGISAATALAIGTESLPVVVAAIVAIGVAWIADARMSRALGLFGLSFALATLLHFLAALPPDRWTSVACDAISLTYLVAAFAIGAGLGLCAVLPLADRPGWQRLIVGLLLGVVIAAGLAIVFPQCLRGPYANLDSWLLDNWIDRIDEAKPLWAAFPASPAFLVAALLPVLIAVATALWHLTHPAGRRRVWIVYLGFIGLTALVMLLQVRGARIALPLALPGVAVAISLLRAAYLRRSIPAGLGLMLAWFAGAGLAVGLVVNAMVPPPHTTVPDGAPATDLAACRLPQSYAQLAALPPARVMSFIDLGAHVLAYTPHAVVGAPYHRNVEGIVDTFAFFNGAESGARDIATRRGLELVVVCRGMPELRGLPDAAPDALARRLANGDPPPWLQPVEGMGTLSVYRIVAGEAG